MAPIERRDRGGIEAITLRDGEATAEVVPGLGAACVGFRLGGWRVLAEPPDDEALATKTSRYGIPVLYPWPNRVADGRFSFGGRALTVPVKAPGPHANHGLARDRAWTVAAAGPDQAGGVSVRCALDLPHPVFHSAIAVTYHLRGSTLTITAAATNTGSDPMPFGFGLHPYFEIPPGHRSRCTIHAPAAAAWSLDGFIPDGRRVPVAGRLDLRAPRALGADPYDDVLTALPPGPFTATLADPVAGWSIAVRSDPSFREHVVYAPADRDVVCLEPYTCATDAFNLAARGIDGGMRVLAPGETWTGTVAITASSPSTQASSLP
ncbi:MAG: aldose 1-epimerase [Myxococcota bacterium]